MRDKSSPETIAYLEAENAHTLSAMASTVELQATLYAEMLSHIKETDESVPYRDRGWFYYTRTIEGSQYPIYCRKSAVEGRFDASQPEQVLVDVNLLAEGQAFMAIGGMSVSPDGWLLAYSTDNTGFRQYTLHVRDLQTGKDLADTALRVGSMVWADDSRTLFYTTEDEVTKRHDHLYRHQLGDDVSRDVLVRNERDERFNLGVGKTRDGKYLVLEAGSHTTNECSVLLASNPLDEFRLIAERVDDQEYYLDHREGLFYLRTNDSGKNFRVVTTSVEQTGRQFWRELIAEDVNAPLEDFDVFEKFYVSSRRRFGLTTIEIQQFADDGTLGAVTPIGFPEPVYTAAGHVNREFDTGAFRYSYQSLVSPASVYRVRRVRGNFYAAEAAGGSGRVRFEPVCFGEDLGDGGGWGQGSGLDGVSTGQVPA